MKKKDLKKFLDEIRELKQLDTEQLLDLYLENNVNLLFGNLKTQELLDEYIKSIVFLYSNLSDLVKEEEYEIASRLNDAIEFEQQEFIRMIKLYHNSPEYTLEEIELAINFINQTTKNSFL